MHRTSLLFLSVLLSLVFVVQADTTIRGRVQNSQTGEPVPNVNVFVKDSEEGTMTNADGEFILETSAFFPITIIVDHIGYSSLEKTVHDSRVLQVDLWPEILKLAPVDVSVVRLPSHYDVSSPKESLNGAELRTRGIQDFQELTRSMSSVVVSSGIDGSQTISIRGSNANETTIYLDGVKINDSFTNIADLAQINMQDIVSIEVIKGASTLPYEVGAFGGVVNIYSHIPDQNKLFFSSSLDLNNGQNTTHTGQLSYVNDSITLNSQLTKRTRNIRSFLDESISEYLFGSSMANWKLALGNFNLKWSAQEAQTQQTESGNFE
ncbi:MAG: TonB-dependent receptor plug domain-containing protein, partial [Candidatus Marinimicrobia bacterium]|nr:TonB-dependent receptor plug domain-containing protein [Candidatus Neomarinimicrobiota bacterium]